MEAEHERTVFVAVPGLLGDVLAVLLEVAGVDIVVRAEASDPPPAVDAAVISGPDRPPLASPVQVHLPDPGGDAGIVQIGDEKLVMEITGPLSILGLLDRYCPASQPRVRRVTEVLRAYAGGE